MRRHKENKNYTEEFCGHLLPSVVHRPLELEKYTKKAARESDTYKRHRHIKLRRPQKSLTAYNEI